ncbi:MAG: SPFH domain-containing protein, partial [Clostridium sp.]|nr:SPFH domain-containing protein [Clostridium sp.]
KRSEVSAFATEAIFNKLNDKGISVTSVNILDLSFSAEFDAAIEKKQIVEQQTQQAKYELEKAKVENEKKIENAKAEAEVMKQQNAEITDKTLELKRLEVQQTLIKKWNVQLPTTMTGSDTSNIFSLNK